MTAQFWGAPPMALMTVGTGTLLLDRDPIGPARWSPPAGCCGLRIGAGASDRLLDPVPGDHQARHRPGRGIRRLADASRSADGLGRQRHPADPVYPARAGEADAAAGLQGGR
jgi:hypothetical protein